ELGLPQDRHGRYSDAAEVTGLAEGQMVHSTAEDEQASEDDEAEPRRRVAPEQPRDVRRGREHRVLRMPECDGADQDQSAEWGRDLHLTRYPPLRRRSS